MMFCAKKGLDRSRGGATLAPCSKASVSLMEVAVYHVFRHSFATHLLEDGYDIRTVQSRTCGMGHKDVRTKMIYPAGAGLSRGGQGV